MFKVNQTYTKKQIYVIAGVPEIQQGGHWHTGYTEYHGDFYVFANIGIPGRTGHNYSNYWDGPDLHWEGKATSHIGLGSITKLLDGGKGTNVFIFTRVNDTDPFTYEGKGAVKEYFDTRPVKIIWTFDNAGNIDNYDPTIPGQIPPGSFPEGAVSQVLVNKHERNPWARRECVKHFGAICQVCNFNFEDYYGEIGKDFIHVHHLKSISAIKSEYQVDPLKDLIPVCPNCHSMLHKRTPALTIQELKQILDLNKHQRRL